MVLRARVLNGRITLDQPTDLPEGTELDLVPLDDEDELEDEDRKRLVAAIREGIAQARRGEGISVDELFARLRST
jgi:hypothetical protein